jgi:hypothetical protein
VRALLASKEVITETAGSPMRTLTDAQPRGNKAGPPRAGVAAQLVESELPSHVDVVDMAPIDGAAESSWLLLGDDGGLTRWSAETGESARLATTAVPIEPNDNPWCGHDLRRRLHVSANGRYAAVVNDYGRYGEVVDLETGRPTFPLDNHAVEGDCAETVPFSFAFAEHQGRVVCIHRTAWNRLDVSLASSGYLLTPRADPKASEPHFLDYFHGALRMSPNGRRVLDDGWAWRPYGVPSVWRLDDWLNFNVRESEDGASRLDLCMRGHYWDRPMAWLDDSRVAVYGIGDSADDMRHGVRIFNVTRHQPVEVCTFEARATTLFGDAGRLYAVSAPGLAVCDPVTGERIGEAPGFTPTRHHRGARELAAIFGRTLVRWSTP